MRLRFRRLPQWPYLPGLASGVLAGVLYALSFLGAAAVLRSGALLLTGAAVTKFLDIWGQQQAARQRAVDQRITGLDEVRRLLHMTRWSLGEPSPELLGTVVNALVHQHGMDYTSDELAFRLMRSGRNGSEELRGWLDTVVAGITDERDALMRGEPIDADAPWRSRKAVESRGPEGT